MSVNTPTTNIYSNCPIKGLEYIQNKALVVAPFEITKAGKLDPDLLLDTPGMIVVHFYKRKVLGQIKEPTADQFKSIGTMANLVDIGLTNEDKLGYLNMNVIFKYDSVTGNRTIERDVSQLSSTWVDVTFPSSFDFSMETGSEGYFCVCQVQKISSGSKASNTSFTEVANHEFLFMIPSSECQELVTDFDILDGNNKVINIKKYGDGSGFSSDTSVLTTTTPLADFFGDGSNIATYLFDGNLKDKNQTYNGTTTNINYENGKFGLAGVFTGTSSATTDLTIPTVFSISFWIKPTAVLPRTVSVLGFNGSNATYLTGSLSSGLGLSIHSPGTVEVSSTGAILTLNTWNHVVITCSSTTASTSNQKIYINGNPVTTQISGSGNFVFSKLNFKSFVGSLDHARVFNRVLTSSEVLALANETSNQLVINQTNQTRGPWGKIVLDVIGPISPDNTSDIKLKDFKLKDFFGDNSLLACYLLDSDTKDETGRFNGIGTDITYVDSRIPGSKAVASSDTSQINCGKPQGTLTSMTVSAWIKWNGNQTVLPFGFLNYSLNFDTAVGFNTSNGDSYGIPSDGFIDTWKHIVIEFKTGSFGKIYIDGVLQTLTQLKGVPNFTNATVANQNFYLFGWGNNASYRNFGAIDDVKIFNRVLTLAEVEALYTEPSSTSSKYTLVKDLVTPELIASEADFFGDNTNVITYLFNSNVMDSKGTNHGTAHNITYAPGKFGQAVIFNNLDGSFTENYIETPYMINLAGPYNISLFVKKTPGLIGSQSTLCSAGVSGSGYNGGFAINHLGTSISYSTNTNNVALGTVALPDDGNWNHIYFSYDGTTAKMYLNGVLASTSTMGHLTGTYPLTFGGGPGFGSEPTWYKWWFNGAIDNVRIFNRELSLPEVQALVIETKKVTYLTDTGFCPSKKVYLDTTKPIQYLTYKTFVASDPTKQEYRVYSVIDIKDGLNDQVTPKFYLGSKYQRNLMDTLIPAVKTKRTIYNLKDMYLVDDICINTLNKINTQLETDQMIKFTERLYNLTTPLTPLKEKLNAELILEYLSTPVIDSQNNDIAATLKTSLMEDYNFTQEEIDNLNDNLNTFKSRARIALATPTIDNDKFRFNLPKTFIDGNRSKTEKKNLLVFGTDAGFDKFNLAGYSTPYSNISKRVPMERLQLDDLTTGLTTLSSLEDPSTIKDFQMSYGDSTQHILFENGNLYACRYVDLSQSYQYNRDGQGFTKQSFPLKLINTNVKSMYCGMFATFIIDNNNDVWALGGYSVSGTSTANPNYDFYGINSSGNYLPNWTKVFNSTPENTPKKVVGTPYTTWLLMESGELFCTGDIRNYYTFDGIQKYTKTWISLASGVLDVDCGEYPVCYTLTNGEVYVGDSTNENGLTTQSTNTTAPNTKILKILTNWIPINQTIVQIECTNENIYYLLSNGDVYGVGKTRAGQLGSMSSYGVATPKKLYTGVKRIVPQLFGRNNVCSVSMVELITGEIKCMGNTSDNKFGYFVEYNTGVTTPITLYPKVDKIFLTERNVLAIIDGKIFNSGWNRFSGTNLTNQTITEQFLNIVVSKNFGDILTNYKQQIPFTYIPLSTNIDDVGSKPVFENLTDITGFNYSEIVIDIPNVL